MRVPTRVAALAAGASLFLGLLAGPSAAAVSPSQGPGTGPGQNSTPSLEGQQMEVEITRQAMRDMDSDYVSLSASMAKAFTSTSDSDKASYLAASRGLMSSLGIPGTASSLPDSLESADLSGMTLGDLNAAVVSSGAGVDFQGFSSLSSAITSMRANATSMDAAVTAAGTMWGEQMLSLRAPSLKTPDVPKVSSSFATRVPTEGLAFGMFMNRSINKMLSNFPDVFKEVTGTGVRDKKAKVAWRESVGAAARSSRNTLERVFPGDCGKDFVTGLSGDVAPGGCTPCSASGLYAYSQLVTAGPLAVPDFSGYPARGTQPPSVDSALSSVNDQSVCQTLGPEVQAAAGQAASRVVRSLL